MDAASPLAVRRWLTALVLCLGIGLGACSAPPTPLPVDIPSTPTPTNIETRNGAPGLSTLRYAVDPALHGMFVDETIPFTVLNTFPDMAALGRDFDVFISFSQFPGAVNTPYSVPVWLGLNPSLTPLDYPELLAAVREFFANSAPDSASIRAAFANAGYPDGFDLILITVNIPSPVLSTLSERLRTINLAVRAEPVPMADALSLLTANRAHAVVFASLNPTVRDTWESQLGDLNLIPLPSLALYAVTASNLTPPTAFTDSGFPLVQ